MFRRIINEIPGLRVTFLKCLLLILVSPHFLTSCRSENGNNYRAWESYRGDEGSNACSQLNQINKENVKQLKVAWNYNSGDKSDYFSLEASPIIWEHQLPCGGYATLATYEVDGKQYVAIAAGGSQRQRTKAGDYYIAFTLP